MAVTGTTFKQGVCIHAFTDGSGFALFDTFSAETLVFQVATEQRSVQFLSVSYEGNALELPSSLVQSLITKGWIQPS